MELWLLYTISTYIVFAITNVIDKYFLERVFKSPMQYTVFGGIIIFPVFFLMPFTGFALTSPQTIALGIISGALLLLSLVPYFRALSMEDATTVIPLGSFTPMLVLLLSFLILGESLCVSQLYAFFLLVVGGALLAINSFGKKRIIFTPALFCIALSWIIFAVYAVMAKILFNSVPFMEGFYLIRMGVVIASASLLMVPGIRKEVSNGFPMLGMKNVFLFSALVIIAIAGQFMYDLAISLGSVSLVSAAQGIQYVVLFILAAGLSGFFPKLLNEKTDKNTIFRKLVGTGLVVAGMYMLNVF